MDSSKANFVLVNFNKNLGVTNITSRASCDAKNSKTPPPTLSLEVHNKRIYFFADVSPLWAGFTFDIAYLSFKMAVHFFAIFFTINILCWIDLVSPQFFPSMHPLTHFAIQAWGAEKMRCQNIIISSSSLQGGGYYPPRLSEENIRICRTNGQSQASNGNLNLNQ